MQRIGCPLCGTDRDVTICPACSRRLQASLSEARALPPGLEPDVEKLVSDLQFYVDMMRARPAAEGLTGWEYGVCRLFEQSIAVLRGGRAVPSPPLEDTNDEDDDPRV